jgi:hypothetical protein
MPQQQFKGYSEDQMKRIASKLGHTGDLDTFNNYLQSNEAAMGKYNTLQDSVTRRYATGGAVTPIKPIYADPLVPNAGITYGEDSTLGQTTLNQSLAPELAKGAVTKAALTQVGPSQMMAGLNSQVGTAPTVTAAQAAASESTTPTIKEANVASTTTAVPAVATSLSTVDAKSGAVSDKAKVNAEEQTTTLVSQLDSAQATATQVEGAPTRTLEGGELVNPVADAAKAAAFTEEIKAAQADPSSKATVQGQLATLMTSFDEGNTPAWAAGAMRNVTAQMAARGIGSSSMAGQALIQTALESALPIATADAQTYASFEVTNLNNKQARAMLSAQQRAAFMNQEFDQAFQSRVMNATKVSEIANMKFNASQQIAIENAQLAGTVNLANLTNRQGLVMAEAASLSQLDISNLNNRQQAQVTNAQAFLDMDMANLTNAQQTSMFKAQANVTTLLSDAAAENASSQFNATSKNQTDQFFSNLSSNINQFNATQKNAQAQFNAGETNTASKFNAEMQDQRDQFNAQNSMVIDQSNAQWRRQIATADTVAVNRANEINAKAVLDVSDTAYANLWQEHRDEMDWAYKNADNAQERMSNIAMNAINAAATVKAAEVASDATNSEALGSSIMSLLTSDLSKTVLSGWL